MQRNRGGRHGSPGQIGCPEKVGHLMDSFMVRGTDGPMQRMVHLRSRCMQLNKQRTTEGRVQWIGDRVLYKDVGFDMDQLLAMVRDLIGQTRRILVEELLLLPAGGGRDGKTTRGWSRRGPRRRRCRTWADTDPHRDATLHPMGLARGRRVQ